MAKKFQINHDFCVRRVTPIFEVPQDADGGLQVAVTLTSNGLPWSVPAGTEAEIRYRDADGLLCAYRKIGETDACQFTGNTVTVDIPKEAVCRWGTVLMQMVLVKAPRIIHGPQWKFVCRADVISTAQGGQNESNT